LFKLVLFTLAALPALAQNATFRANHYATNCLGTPSFITGDFDGDGKVDIALQCDSVIYIYPGGANGTLLGARAGVTIPNRPTPSTGEVIVAADFNHDGKTDLGIQEVTSSGMIFQVLLSNGDGTFKAPITSQIYSDPKAPVGVDFAADLTKDGAADLILHGGTSIGIMINNGAGSFAAPLFYTAGNFVPVGVADLTGDGVPDLIAIDPYNNYAAFLSKGDGTFAGQIGLFNAPPAARGSVVFADFNGDGANDIGFAASSSSCPACFYVAALQSNGYFAQPVKSTARVAISAAGDFNDDGRADLIQDAADVGSLAVLYSGADATLKPSGLVDVGGAPSSLFVADLNGDGRPDVVSVHQLQGQSAILSVFINTTPAFARVKSIKNAASFAEDPITPGSLISIFGNALATGALAQATAVPLPFSLGGASVKFNGLPGALMFTSLNQINAQVPWKLTPNISGVVVVQVTVGGVDLPPFAVRMSAYSPAIFATQSGAGPGIAINQDATLAAATGSIPGIATRPSKPGEVIFILGTGLGAVDVGIADGAASGDALRYTAVKPRVLIGGASAQVLFYGLSPQFVGVNQLNVIVPDGIDPGTVPLQISIGGVTSTDKVTMAVGKP